MNAISRPCYNIIPQSRINFYLLWRITAMKTLWDMFISGDGTQDSILCNLPCKSTTKLGNKLQEKFFNVTGPLHSHAEIFFEMFLIQNSSFRSRKLPPKVPKRVINPLHIKENMSKMLPSFLGSMPHQPLEEGNSCMLFLAPTLFWNINQRTQSAKRFLFNETLRNQRINVILNITQYNLMLSLKLKKK